MKQFCDIIKIIILKWTVLRSLKYKWNYSNSSETPNRLVVPELSLIFATHENPSNYSFLMSFDPSLVPLAWTK